MAATSLEIAFTRAFNELIQDGTWASIFGPTEVEMASLCSGAPENWPIPVPEEGSDLQRVLETGEFWCGYPTGLAFSSEVTGVPFIDSTDPNNTTGYIVDFWDKIGERIGDMYQTEAPIVVGWNTSFDSSNNIFTSLSNGEFDSACARFSPDGTWTDPATSAKRPRSLAFSNMLCASYLERSWIFVLPETAAAGVVDSFEALAEAIANGSVANVCTPTQPESGTVTSCSLQINRFLQPADTTTSGDFKCIGKSDAAFADLDAGVCDAVWGSAAADTSSYSRFSQPTITAWSSFFRNDNLPQEEPLLSAGAIAGIVIGAVAFVGLLFLALYHIKTKQQERRLKLRFVRQVARNISITSSPNQLSADDIAKELRHISGDGGGAVTKTALKTWLDDGKLGELSDKDFDMLWAALDSDNSGLIDPVEFCTYLSACGDAFDEVNREQQAMSKDERIMFASRRLSAIKKNDLPVVEDL